MTKVCTRCGVTRPISEYSKRSRSADGLRHDCKPCAAAAQKAWYESNKERRAAAGKAWRESNKERVAAINRAWRESNKERVAAMSKARREFNKERVAATRKAHRERNSEAYKFRVRARRRASKQARPKWLTPEQRDEMNTMYKRARALTIETGILHHVDHIVPLKHPLVCGLHVPWNLQVLTQPENDSKGNNFDGGWGTKCKGD
jgi:5-methylcytosine-specific restriction endonuclease McrA